MMKEQELTRLEKLSQVRKILTKVIVTVFFILIIVFMVAGGNLKPFYLPIPDAITVCLAGIFTATWFFGAFTLGEIAFEVSDTRRVLSAKKNMKKATVYGVVLLTVGVFMFHPVIPITVKELTKTDLSIGYGKYFNISFVPRDPHGFSYPEEMTITASQGSATVIIAEIEDFTANYASGRYMTYFVQALNNTTTGSKSCAQFLTPERIGKEYVIHIVKDWNATLRIEIDKTVRVDAINAWGMLMTSSGILLILWAPVVLVLKKRFERGSVLK